MIVLVFVSSVLTSAQKEKEITIVTQRSVPYMTIQRKLFHFSTENPLVISFLSHKRKFHQQFHRISIRFKIRFPSLKLSEIP